uniref:Uncharacterized protein n=1 Tax=Siphoviridae sp. ctXQ014 TaxID=2825542 RepID=A0A8S5PMW2_9CAUD|nr:MAG TPA: hypothetical protein [Siphoviridae sp. ctXQ014]
MKCQLQPASLSGLLFARNQLKEKSKKAIPSSGWRRGKH